MIKKFITTPRTIGIILVVIAALVYYTGQPGSFGLATAGILLLIAPAKHAKAMFDLFIQTFQNWKTIIITALYDAIFWLLIFGAVYFLKWKVELKVAATQASSTLSREGLTNPELAHQTAQALQGFVHYIFTSAAIALVFAFIIYTLSRSLIWATIAKQKVNKKFVLKFTALNAFWWIIWVPIFLLTVIGSKESPTTTKQAIGVFLTLAFYFTPIVHTLYMKKRLIGHALGNGIAWGIAKIHRFIIPYTFIFIAYVILYQIYRIAENTPWIKPASILFVVLFIAWVRTYVYEIVKEFK